MFHTFVFALQCFIKKELVILKYKIATAFRNVNRFINYMKVLLFFYHRRGFNFDFDFRSIFYIVDV